MSFVVAEQLEADAKRPTKILKLFNCKVFVIGLFIQKAYLKLLRLPKFYSWVEMEGLFTDLRNYGKCRIVSGIPMRVERIIE
jgi:hypothetical protein